MRDELDTKREVKVEFPDSLPQEDVNDLIDKLCKKLDKILNENNKALRYNYNYDTGVNISTYSLYYYYKLLSMLNRYLFKNITKGIIIKNFHLSSLKKNAREQRGGGEEDFD